MSIVVLAGVILLAACSGPASAPDPADAGPSQASSSASSPTITPGRLSPAPVGTTAAIPSPSSTDPGGMRRSGIRSSGQFVENQITISTNTDWPDQRGYAVLVETSVPESADGAARAIQAILDSPQGWAGSRGVAFNLVNDPSAADLVLQLAAPGTVDKGCAQFGTNGLWSCQMGRIIYLNADRWFYATPTWADLPIEEYRAYLINHEVGHYLGFGHVGCPAAGQPSPVMQQQSIQLNGCLPNPWPDVTGENRR